MAESFVLLGGVGLHSRLLLESNVETPLNTAESGTDKLIRCGSVHPTGCGNDNHCV